MTNIHAKKMRKCPILKTKILFNDLRMEDRLPQ